MNRQVEVKELFKKIDADIQEPTYLQGVAGELLSLGLNVSLMPYGQKFGWRWEKSKYTRLIPEHLYDLIAIAKDNVNLIIITGRTSENLFILDCENEGIFFFHRTKLQEKGIPLWTVKTARGGHIYLRSKHGPVKNVSLLKCIEQGFGDYEIRGNSNYVLGPASYNQEKKFLYRWVDQEGESIPVVDIEELDWIPLELAAKEQDETPEERADRIYTEHIDRVVSATKGTRNDTFVAAALALFQLADDGWLDHDEVEDDLRKALTKNGYLAERGIHYFNFTIKWALNEVKLHDKKTRRRNEIPEYIALAEQFLDTCEFDSRERTIMLAIAHAMLDVSRITGRRKFRFTTREAAEKVRINRKTASKYLRKLVDIGFVDLIVSGRRKPHIYAFPKHRGELNIGPLYKTTNKSGPNFNSIKDIPDMDLSERRNLGKTGSMVFNGLLEHGPTFATELSQKIGLNRNAVNYALKKLTQKIPDYVGKNEQGYFIIKGVDLEIVERRLSNKEGEKRAKRHLVERSKFIYDELLTHIVKLNKTNSEFDPQTGEVIKKAGW